VFELRILCDPGDADRITAALATALTLGTVRRYPSRDGLRDRLYVTADLPPTTNSGAGTGPQAGWDGVWPTFQAAYRHTPDVLDEMAWLTATDANPEAPTDPASTWNYWLRKAALFDRIARYSTDPRDTEDAKAAATHLLNLTPPPNGPHLNPAQRTAAETDPLGYVRFAWIHRETT
jgi:hypothetical protein